MNFVKAVKNTKAVSEPEDFSLCFCLAPSWVTLTLGTRVVVVHFKIYLNFCTLELTRICACTKEMVS